MNSSDIDLSGEIEQAWTGFRARLADRLAELVDDDHLMVEMESSFEEDPERGAAPYVQFVGWGGGLVRAEAVSNAYLDDDCCLSDEGGEHLVGLGWAAPTYGPADEPDSGSCNFYVDLEVRDADRLAVMTVSALREVYGCAHPAFLSAEGLELDPEAGIETAPAFDDDDGQELLAVFPDDHDELRLLVDQALSVMFAESLQHDEDGDVPVTSGKTTVFVRTLPDRPAVDFFADLVIGIEDLERAETEVTILNRSQPMAKFVLRDDCIALSYRLHTWPFAPAQLRVVLAQLLDGLDDLARDVALRTGGLRFLEPPPGAEETLGADSPVVELDPAMIGLLELLQDGPLAASSVAALFDDDRLELIRQIVMVRTAGLPQGAPDVELVLGHLRAALRHVADRQGRATTKGRRRIPPRPSSRQLPLLPDSDEETLDSGSWVHDQPGA